MSIPDPNPVRTVATNTVIGFVGGVPVVGGTLAGAIQGVLAAQSEARTAEWFVMADARFLSLSEEVRQLVNFDNPEFVAAAHRLTRAAQETADNEKRDRLAAALAHSGPWSDLPIDKRERMQRLIAELSSREVYLLRILSDPRGWLTEHEPEAVSTYDNAMAGSPWSFIDGHIIRGDETERDAVRSAIEALQRRGLVDVPVGGMMTGSGILQGRATGLGWELIHYLNGIGV